MQEKVAERTNTNYSKRRKRGALILISFVLLVTLLYVYVLRPTITGLTVLIKEVAYNESLYLTFNENSEYEWFLTNAGELKNLKLSGSLTEGAKAKVFIEHNDLTYLVFDSSQLTEGDLSAITGLVVLNETEPVINESLTNETVINQTTTNETEPIINETQPIIEKSISLNLEYEENSDYDADNNGIETLTGIIDFAISADFSWDVSYDQLCTKWDIYSIENEISTIVCYGSSDCCSLMDLIPEKTSWNETFYLNYGKYGAANNNKITAQVIYSNYSLELENPYSDIAYSNYDELTAGFLPVSVNFSNICIDTCLLSGLNASSYKLIINVSNGTLSLTQISYNILTTAENKAPVLVKNISAIDVNKNENITIDLNEYFTDPDGDSLTYTYYDVENVTITIEDNLAAIVPDKDFAGKRFSFFTANDSTLTTVSDVFAINVEEVKEIIYKFIIKDPSGADIASIDSNGTMQIKGSVYENELELAPPENSFIVQNKSKDAVAYINSTGHVFLKGSLTEQAVMSAAGYNLEIRNSDDELIAFFDDSGNLKLKGDLNESIT